MQPLAARPTRAAAEAVLAFWFDEAKPFQWWRRDPEFDEAVKSRFGALHEAATAGRLDAWRAHPRYCLALILLLDQFSRNIYRGNARAFAQDGKARAVASDAVARRFDFLASPRERAFFYMPFMHSETLADQERSVALYKARMAGSMNEPHAREHHDIIERFGRFPHRNKVLGRPSTAQEIAYLDGGGFNP